MQFQLKCISLSLLFFVASTFVVKDSCAQKTDFSGSWKLNESKTDFGHITRNSASLTYTIKQDKKSITLERNGKDNNGEYKYSETFPFDGKQVKSTIGKTHKLTSIIWSQDGGTLTAISECTYQDSDGKVISYKRTMIISLSDDGQTLSFNIIDQGEDGDYHAVYVYDKVNNNNSKND